MRSYSRCYPLNRCRFETGHAVLNVGKWGRVEDHRVLQSTKSTSTMLRMKLALKPDVLSTSRACSGGSILQIAKVVTCLLK